MADTKPSRTFEGLPQELRDMIYREFPLSHNEASNEPASVSTGAISILRISKKTREDFNAVVLRCREHPWIIIGVTNFDFAGVIALFERYNRALETGDFELRVECLGQKGCDIQKHQVECTVPRSPRNLTVKLKCTEAFLKDLMGGRESSELKMKLVAWADYCRSHRLTNMTYRSDGRIGPKHIEIILQAVNWWLQKPLYHGYPLGILRDRLTADRKKRSTTVCATKRSDEADFFIGLVAVAILVIYLAVNAVFFKLPESMQKI